MEPMETDAVEAEAEADPVTEALVKNAMAELKTKKKQKEKTQQVKVETGKDVEERKGKTFAQIEEEETGGTVREAMVGMAHAKRAVKRKGKGVGDTELVANVEDAEEEIETEAKEDNGEIELTAFNLKEERETGYFDADGHYVERKDEDEDATDAWLQSTEANMADEKTRQAHKKMVAAMKKADADEPMSESRIAELKGQAAEFMLEGESVTRALQRLGGGSKKPVLKSKNKKKKGEEEEQAAVNPANVEKFNKLTEIIDSLLEAGEMDVYRETKHIFERQAAMYKKSTFLDKKGESDDDGGGMFADDSDEEEAKEEPVAKRQAMEAAMAGPSSAAAASAPTAQAAPSEAAAPESDTTDYGSWPVKELQRFLREHGQDPSGAVEKSDLVERVRGVAAAGPARTAVPAGYLFHAESGYYWGAADSMYFHAESGKYYNPLNGAWCSWDAATGKFMPVPTGS